MRGKGLPLERSAALRNTRAANSGKEQNLQHSQANSVPPKGQVPLDFDGNAPHLTEDQIWLRDRCPEIK